MALMTGFVEMRDSEPSIGMGGRFRRISEAGTLPVGPGHAVEEGEAQALCGASVITTHTPWPPGPMMQRCPACENAVRAES